MNRHDRKRVPRTAKCEACGRDLTCTMCGDPETHGRCPRADEFALECRHCIIAADPFRPGDRVAVVPCERGPKGRWWTVPWYPGCDGDEDGHDTVFGDEEILVRGVPMRPLVNRKAGGHAAAGVPEGPFTVLRWNPPETWAEAADKQHRRALWNPVLAGSEVRQSQATVLIAESPLQEEYGAAWFERVRESRMYARREPSTIGGVRYDRAGPSERFVELHGGDGPIVQIAVRERFDGEPLPDGVARHWAWWGTKEKAFRNLWPRRAQVEVCFTYGPEVEERHGRGRLCEVVVTEVP